MAQAFSTKMNLGFRGDDTSECLSFLSFAMIGKSKHVCRKKLQRFRGYYETHLFNPTE